MPELVARVGAVDERLAVRYEPDLLPPIRFPCDHRGVEYFRRTPDQEERWWAMLGEAEVLLGLPGDSAAELAQAVRAVDRLRWVQATAGGAGEQVRAAELTGEELGRVMITRASGVHAGQPAEFVPGAAATDVAAWCWTGAPGDWVPWGVDTNGHK